jgi:hypothetical protein
MKLKNITLFENAGELVDAFYSHRPHGDPSPFITTPIKLIASSVGKLELVGEGSELFQIASGITLDDIIYVMVEQLGVRLEME